MSRELSQAQLERMVNGDDQLPNVVFYEQAVLDHAASNELGDRVYRKSIFIKITQPGVTDWVSYKAQKADIAAYPEEFEFFMGNKQGTRAPGVEIIPNLDITHLQELIDRGLTTIPKLAETLQVPQHLEYALHAARAINKVLQEQQNVPEEESEPQERAIPESEMPQADRQVHPVGLRQPSVQTSYAGPKGDSPERLQTSGRFNGNRNIIDNWKVVMG